MSDGGDYNELVYESKSSIPTDFSVHKKTSSLYFSVKHSYTKLNNVEKMKEKFKKELSRKGKK